jgi:putative flippase GtrA
VSIQTGEGAVAEFVGSRYYLISHNRWSQHQGLRSVRGFLSFALISVMSLSPSQSFYLNFIHVDALLPMIISHLISIRCDFARGACTSYMLNGALTWPRARSMAAGKILQVQEN